MKPRRNPGLWQNRCNKTPNFGAWHPGYGLICCHLEAGRNAKAAPLKTVNVSQTLLPTRRMRFACNLPYPFSLRFLSIAFLSASS
jgi:hypothetical protein